MKDGAAPKRKALKYPRKMNAVEAPIKPSDVTGAVLNDMPEDLQAGFGKTEARAAWVRA